MKIIASGNLYISICFIDLLHFLYKFTMHLPTTGLNDHISFVLYMSNTIHILGEF